jgi:hypothetical protein
MNDVPEFFMYGTKLHSDETLYAELAARCGHKIPNKQSRVYRIVFQEGQKIWTATVGEQIAATPPDKRKKRTSKKNRYFRLDDSGIVIAIFAGEPYVVYTDLGTPQQRASKQVNMIRVEDPIIIEYFAW